MVFGIVIGIVVTLIAGYFLNKGFQTEVKAEVKTIQAEVASIESKGTVDVSKIKTAASNILAKL